MATKNSIKRTIQKNIRSSIFISDIHHPYSLTPAWNITLKIIKDEQPDLVHIGGDGVDFHSISRHPKALVEATHLKWERDESAAEWARLRKAAPNAQINYQEGNHDARMAIYLRDRAPELADLPELAFPALMQIDRLGFNWIPEGEKYAVGQLWHHHGHKLAGAGVSPAKAKFLKTMQNLVFGHHHTFDYFSFRQYGTNKLYQSFANASLYTLEPEYAHHTHWHVGFTAFDFARNGEFAGTQIHITETGDGGYQAIYKGRVYESYEEENIDLYISK